MTCQDWCNELVAYLEGLLDETPRSQLESHLAQCPACQGELWELRQLTDRLAREGFAVPPVCLDSAVMDRLLREQTLELRRWKMSQSLRILGIGGILAATVGLLVGLSVWLMQPTGTVTAAEAAEVLCVAPRLCPGFPACMSWPRCGLLPEIIFLPSTPMAISCVSRFGNNSEKNRNGGWRNPAGSR